MELLNILFIVFHTVLILFNCFGWLFRKTLRWNLITLLATFISWFGLGIFYGWGFCLCTEWHWQVRRELGYTNDPNSYIQFLLNLLTGKIFDEKLIDTVTVIVFFAALTISIVKNIKVRRKLS